MTRFAQLPRLPAVVLLVFAVALGLRLGHLYGLRAAWDGTQLFAMARGDAADHWREAQSILAGEHPLGRSVPWKGIGYSYYLAGLIAAVGTDPGALRFPCALLGALNCALLVVLARRRFDLATSAIAGLLAATNGVLILFDGELFFPTLLISLSLGAFLLLSSPRAPVAASAAGGLCMGLATLVHAVYALPALAIALRLVQRRSRLRALIFLAALGVSVLPVSLANWIGAGQPVLVSWNGGINLFLGSQPTFDQASGQATSAWHRVLSSTEESGLVRESDRDRHYLRLAARQWRTRPLESTRVLATKVRAILSPIEISNNVRLYEIRDRSPVLRATMGRNGRLAYPFVFWLPAALIGAWLLWRARRVSGAGVDLLGWVVAWGGGLLLSILLAFNTARYRAPLVFFGCLFAAFAIRWSIERVRARGPRALLLPAGIYALLVLLVAAIAMEQRALPAPAAWSQALYCEANGKTADARRWLELALAENPDDPSLLLEAVRFHTRHGDVAAASSLLERVLRREDLEPDLRVMALEESAFAAMRTRDWETARAALASALVLDVDRGLRNGKRDFWVELAPVTRCRLELLLADVELRAQQPEIAMGHWEEFQTLCPKTGGELQLTARRVELSVRTTRKARSKE